jgi:hypothetical protein
VAIHPAAEGVAQDRSVDPVTDGAFDRPSHCGRQRNQDDLAAFAPHA